MIKKREHPTLPSKCTALKCCIISDFFSLIPAQGFAAKDLLIGVDRY